MEEDEHFNPYILYELSSLTETISSPLKNAQRIKYICFDVSDELIVFGATSGGVYIFNKNPYEFVQLIPNKNGTIMKLAISPEDAYIGYANIKGSVSIVSFGDACGKSTPTLLTTKHHTGRNITSLAWSVKTQLFIGDDVGAISVLSTNYSVRSIFQDPGQIIMTLDSKICQLDLRFNMLLVSTLTKSFICDTERQQYRQIGIKSRDGDFGACFASGEEVDLKQIDDKDDIDKDVHSYDMLNGFDNFAIDDRLSNTVIFCARPGFRLWETTIDGLVKSTHQFKDFVKKAPSHIYKDFDQLVSDISDSGEEISMNLTCITPLKDNVIFSYNKSAMYFLNIYTPHFTQWYTQIKDISECKVYKDEIFVWQKNGELIQLKYVKIDNLLLNMYLNRKYTLCVKICKMYKEYFEKCKSISPKLKILSELTQFIVNENDLADTKSVLEVFSTLKNIEKNEEVNGNIKTEGMENNYVLESQSSSFTNNFNEGDRHKVVLGKFEPNFKLEGLASSIGVSLQDTKNNLQSEEILANNTENASDLTEDEIVKSIYHQYKFASFHEENDKIDSIFMENICDIYKLCDILEKLEKYCLTINVDRNEIDYMKSYLFLLFAKRCDIEEIIKDMRLHSLFIESSSLVNSIYVGKDINKCLCGYPLPGITPKNLLFDNLIKRFVEKLWYLKREINEQKMDIIKKLPSLWIEIIHLRQQDEIENILELLLQISDRNLLLLFIPRFTEELWKKTIILYSKLYNNFCLNCNMKFHNVNIREILSWDDMSAFILKQFGAKKCLQILDEQSEFMACGALSMKFHHTALTVDLFEKYDRELVPRLVDALYAAYDHEDARNELIKLLQKTYFGEEKSKPHRNASLPLVIASKSSYWGHEAAIIFSDVLEKLKSKEGCNCNLCYLPLVNDALLKDNGLYSFVCGHIFHGVCLGIADNILCPSCKLTNRTTL